MLNVIEKSEGGRIQTTHLDISYELSKIENLSKDIDFTIHNKFCTECVVVADHIDKKELKDKIKDMGDSMVMAGSQSRVKVHIHTNEPAKLFKICNIYGKVIDRKVDDMTKQEKLFIIQELVQLQLYQIQQLICLKNLLRKCMLSH